MPHQITAFYQRHAHALDAARRGHWPERAWLHQFLRAAPRTGEILDLGCGAGEPLDRALIDQGYQVTGVDVSAHMIHLARTRFPRHHWVEEDMRAFAAEERRFSGVLMWSSLMHLPASDHAGMLSQIGRWLRKGGVALFNTGIGQPPEFDALLPNTPDGDATLAPFQDSLTRAQYHEILADNGLTIINHVTKDMTCGGMTIWLVGKL